MTPLVLMLWLVFGSISFLLVIMFLAFFGKLMWLQFKVWILAKKGYHQVEHIGLNKVRTYYYLRPRDNKFDLLDGFYLHIPETVTKTDSLLPGINKSLKLKSLDDIKADAPEFERLTKRVNSLKYDLDAVTLRWGIPTITYVGNDPSPVKFGEHEKVYGAQVIRDIYIRLLATQQYKKLMKMIMICAFGAVGIAIALLLLYTGYRSANNNIASLVSMLNESQKNYIGCLNTTARILGQNSTIIV